MSLYNYYFFGLKYYHLQKQKNKILAICFYPVAIVSNKKSKINDNNFFRTKNQINV